MKTTEKSWATRLGWLALIVAAAGGLAMFVGATMVRYADGASKLDGFSWVPFGMMIAAGGILLAVVALVWRLATKCGSMRPALLGLLVAAFPLGWLAAQIIPAGDVPPIHDVTTDLDNPPAFTTLTLPQDNLRGVETDARWRELHRDAYGDIKPLVVATPLEQVVIAATVLANEKGWAIADSEPAEGRLEATATVSYYRFDDDVVLRVTDAGNGRRRVDMRSVSRVGVSDLGYNAVRVRDFLAELKTRLES